MKQKSKHISTIEAKKIAMKDISKDFDVNYVYHEKTVLKDCKRINDSND